MKSIFLIFAAGVCLFFTGCHRAESTADIPAVTSFELERYLGIWHEAARMPHAFERDMTHVTAEYRKQPDGTIQVLNRGIRKGKKKEVSGIARQKVPGSGELEVSFFRPFYGAYRIIALAQDYSAALVTSGTRDYAWILVREPRLAKKYLTEYTALLKQRNFDTGKLVYPEMKTGETQQ